MKSYHLATLLCLSTACAVAQPANEIPSQFRGNWAETRARCAPNGPAADAIEVVGAREFHGYEYGCKVTRVQSATATTLTAKALCSESGESAPADLRWQLLDGGAKVSREGRQVLVRCGAR